jgi:hypothetical protein
VSASFSDPGTADTHTCTITWGDGASSTGSVSETGGSGTCNGSHTYTAAGNDTITFKVTDNAGAVGTATVAIKVTPPPPLAVTPGANATVNEGATTTFALGSFSGGTGPYTVTVTWGDGTSSTFTATPGAISAAHRYVNDQAAPFTVTVKVTDSTGATATGNLSVTVKNVAPTVSISSPVAGSLLKAGSSVSVNAPFSDAGTADTHTCNIAWGDGTTTNGTVNESGGAGTCSGSHTYAIGNYSITVTVTDSGGGATSASVAISVTRTGKGLYRPAGTATGLVLAPYKAPAKLRTKSHLVAKKTTTLSATAFAQLRRVLRFEPKRAPRL